MIEYQDAMTILASIQGCTFAGLDTVTVPVLKGGKANPMQGKIEKHCMGSRILLFTNKESSGYLNKVRRHLEKEGKDPNGFQMGPLPWGERVPNSPFILNKGEYYLQAVFLKPPVETKYFLVDGELGPNSPATLIDKQDIIGLNEKTGSEHQGLDAQVIVRTYKLSSIKALRAFNDEIIG